MRLSGGSVMVAHKPSLFFVWNSYSNISPPFPLNCSFRVVKGESSKGSPEFAGLVHTAFSSIVESFADRMSAEVRLSKTSPISVKCLVCALVFIATIFLRGKNS